MTVFAYPNPVGVSMVQLFLRRCRSCFSRALFLSDSVSALARKCFCRSSVISRHRNAKALLKNTLCHLEERFLSSLIYLWNYSISLIKWRQTIENFHASITLRRSVSFTASHDMNSINLKLVLLTSA